MNLNIDGDMWKFAMETYQYYIEHLRKKNEHQDNLLKDITRVFTLQCASTSLKHFASGDVDLALKHLNACTLICYQFLTQDDANY
jgi:hypothetical protein